MWKTVLWTILIIGGIVRVSWAADQPSDEMITREVRKLIEDALWHDYDIDKIQIQEIQEAHDVLSSRFKKDYGLVKVLVKFSAIRNENRSAYVREDGKTFSLNKQFYEDYESCKKLNHLYLHCGVKKGYVFEGSLNILMATTRKGWKILSDGWRRLSSYPLQGYLLMDGREKEGYVWFPNER